MLRKGLVLRADRAHKGEPVEDRNTDASYDIPGIQERAGEFVASSRDAIITVDEQSRIVLFNPAAERMFGCTAKDAIGGMIDGFMPQ
jgi:PAS domain-containing protein